MTSDEPKPDGNGTAPAIPLTFEEALAAAVKTTPEPQEAKPFGKRDKKPPRRYDQRKTGG